MPPVGWIIRFVPTGVAVSEPHYDNLQIVPNPTSTFITIPSNGGYVQIMNSLGRIVHEQNSGNNILDVSSFTAGKYFVRVISKDKAAFGSFVKL